MTPPPESILPPAPKFTIVSFSAVIAIPLCIVVTVIAWQLSFWLVHGAGLIHIAIASVFIWPGAVVVLLLGESGLPDALVFTALICAEYLYLWGVLFLIMKAIARYRARASNHAL